MKGAELKPRLIRLFKMKKVTNTIVNVEIDKEKRFGKNTNCENETINFFLREREVAISNVTENLVIDFVFFD